MDTFFARTEDDWLEERDYLHLVYTGVLERVVGGRYACNYGRHSPESAQEFAARNGFTFRFDDLGLTRP
jgi:hypothetical protein